MRDEKIRLARWLQEAQQEKENHIREAPQAEGRLEGLQAEVSTVSRGECPKWVKGVGGGDRSFASRVVAGATSSADDFEQMRAELVQLRRKSPKSVDLEGFCGELQHEGGSAQGREHTLCVLQWRNAHMDGTASTRQSLGEQVGKVGGRGCYPIARLDAPRCHRVMWRSRIGEPTQDMVVA